MPRVLRRPSLLEPLPPDVFSLFFPCEPFFMSLDVEVEQPVFSLPSSFPFGMVFFFFKSRVSRSACVGLSPELED